MRGRSFVAVPVGLLLGAAAGWLVGRLVRSDNVPFFVALAALAGLFAGLAWARVLRPRVLAVLGVLALALLVVVFTPPRAPIGNPAAEPAAELTDEPAAAASPTPQAGGLTAGEIATLSSLRQVDDYPLYSMRYQAGRPRPLQPPQTRPVPDGTSNPTFACSLFAALGDPGGRLFGRNFDWRYSPGLLLFTDREETGGYASVSMVDLAYFGFGDAVNDLTALPLAERRALLDAPDWPFDGLNEAGVAVGMAAVPQADERHDPGKPAIDSLTVMREILDHAGSVDEAVAILKGHNITWEGGPALHYLVADRAGRSALVEFYGGEIAVLPNAGPWHAATNFTRSAVAGDAAGQCRRYDALIRRLTATGGALDPAAALGLLRSVAQTESATQWSVVYGLNTGRVDIVMGRRYDRVHTFQAGAR
jgi:hypothetical protein